MTPEAYSYEIELVGTADGGDRIPDLSPRDARDRWLDKLRVSKTDSTVSLLIYNRFASINHGPTRAYLHSYGPHRGGSND